MIRRRVVRAVMLTPDRHILLMRVQEPVSGNEFWVTPGGGLEPGESDEDALRREVGEETGATRFSVDRLVWTRRVEFTWDNRDYSQNEYFYRVQTDRIRTRHGRESGSGRGICLPRVSMVVYRRHRQV